jgi:sulfate permease, SulP family
VLGLASDPDADDFFAELSSVLRHLGDTSVTTLMLSLGTIAVQLGLGRLIPQVPAPLVAVAGGIAAVVIFGLDVALIAEVPSGLPVPRMPAFDNADALLPGAVAIALMAYLETVSVGRSVRRPADPPIDNDQELVANGAASVAGPSPARCRRPVASPRRPSTNEPAPRPR